MKAYDITLTGVVQGVGFRYFARMTANRLGISGWVRNCPDGSVEMHCEGDDAALDRFAAAMKQGAPGSVVTSCEIHEAKLTFSYGFEVHG